jgi:serpin B
MRKFTLRSLHLAPLTMLALGASVASVACTASTSPAPAPGPTSFSVVQSNLARNTSPSAPVADQVELAKDNTAFALDLYHQATAGNETDNFFYSPYSISLALAMTYAGANGETAQQMAQALHFTLPAARLHPAFDAIDLALASRAQGNQGTGGKGFTLNVADSLWGDRTLTFQKAFLDTLAVDYGSGLRVTDFANAPSTALDAINGWVSTETDQKIPTLLQPADITSDTKFVLVNAIYFDAAWESPFDAKQTKPATFTHLDGSTVQANEMSQSSEYTYASGSNWQAVELPYSGGQTSMVVVLPNQGQFATVETALDATFVGSLFSSLKIAEVNLSLPKFSIQGSTISLKQELTKLGMTDAFDPAKADLTAMIDASQGPIWIGDVLHQAFVNVDENGTEAAAATAVIGVGTAASGQTETVAVNRPFFVLIRDIPTNTLVFAGRVLDPGQ